MGKLGCFIGIAVSLCFLSCNTGVFSTIPDNFLSSPGNPSPDDPSSTEDEIEITIDIRWE